MDAFSKAATNRSIRTIKTELEFLQDSNLLTPQQVTAIHALLPDAPASSSTISPTPQTNSLPLPPPRNQPSYNEKSNPITPTPPSPAIAPPPAYPASQPIANAMALYAYTPTDEGDLALQAKDRVVILEFMNVDWAKGRNERTGEEGIFPRAYVRVEEDKGVPPPPTHAQYNAGYGRNAQSNYGNMPLDVSQGNSSNGPPSKAEEQGKKFGKKLGNAAIFGAGATIGGKIVNGIF